MKKNILKSVCDLKKKSVSKKKKGVTLVELIVVLAIIAVLTVSMIPQFSGYITEAQKVSALDEAKQIVLAYESIQYNNSSLNESSKIEDIISASNDFLSSNTITELSSDLTYGDCKNILNTEMYKFSFDNTGKVTSGNIVSISAN